MINTIELFNLDKKGNPITWSIQYDTEENWYTTSTGRVGGAITTTERTYCFGKNKGRANETSDIEQCVAEVQSKVEKQTKRGFQPTIPEKKQFEVTLATEFSKRKRFIDIASGQWAVSAKLDGFRCYITKNGMFSRTHHTILSCPHIWEEVKDMFNLCPDMVLDGEIYSHDLKDDFNKVASLISRTKNLTDEFLAETKRVLKFHLFEMDPQPNVEAPYKYFSRNFMLFAEDKSYDKHTFLIPFELSDKTYDYVVGVRQQFVNSFEAVEKLLDLAIEQGFEGIMLRNTDNFYVQGRTNQLVKYKRFKDSEYKIINIEEGVGNHTGQAAIITCEDTNGETFAAGTGKGWDEAAKRDLFANREKYIGRMATLVYQDLTPDRGVPRFPKLKCII